MDEKTKNGQKIVVEISDEILRAVGDGSRDIVNYIGYITRCTCPLKVRKWTDIWEGYGEGILIRVKVTTTIVVCHTIVSIHFIDLSLLGLLL